VNHEMVFAVFFDACLMKYRSFENFVVEGRVLWPCFSNFTFVVVFPVLERPKNSIIIIFPDGLGLIKLR
jgi:hypothetical protein